LKRAQLVNEEARLHYDNALKSIKNKRQTSHYVRTLVAAATTGGGKVFEKR
jgi:hypothetical protein